MILSFKISFNSILEFWNFFNFFLSVKISSLKGRWRELNCEKKKSKNRHFPGFYMYQVYSLVFITHGASGVRNFWHLSAKILYTVEPKIATSPCVHFEVAASPTEKKTSLLHVSIFSHFEIVEIIGPNNPEINLSASFAWTTDNFQALLKGIFSWVFYCTFCWQI